MALQFGLLGSVEAHMDGHPVAVGPARQRCVLAALLVDAQRPVSVDRLVDRVWGARPPTRAENSLYSYVSRLRSAFDGQVTIARGPTGYTLSVEAEAVDLHRFHQLVAEAKSTVDARSRDALLGQALLLWRGDAFETLDTPWINGMREALSHERLEAQLDRVDLRLAAGEHQELLAELTERTHAHPLDERIAAQLMIALHRNGRTGDALAQYQRTSAQLVDDLGLDPSPVLTLVHRQILAGEDFPPPPLGPTVIRPIPQQLPASPPHFTGRADELSRLNRSLGKQQANGELAISTITGTGGVGKTWLAVRWAHLVADAFPDGQLYINLRGFDRTRAGIDPTTAIRGFLDALGTSTDSMPSEGDALAAFYRSALAGKRVLLVLDNARDADQVRPLLPGSPGCLVIVTSRNHLSALAATDGATPLALDLMSPADARELLRRRVGADRVAGEPAATATIIERCARLPLALAIVASRAAINPSFSLAALAADLDTSAGLDSFVGDDSTTDLRLVFSWSYQTLSNDGARLFRLLGLHAGPDLTAPAAASLAGVAVPEVRRSLAELLATNLVMEQVPGRYSFHDLVRTYAAEQAARLDDARHRRAARHRLLDHYLHSGQTAARALYGPWNELPLPPPEAGVVLEHLDRNTAMAWFVAEQSVLAAAVHDDAGAGFESHAWRLAWTMTNFLEAHGRWRDWASMQRAALAAAHRVDDPTGQAHSHHGLGRACIWLDRLDEARLQLERAIAMFEALGERSAVANACFGLGFLDDRMGRDAEALAHTRRALELYRADGNLMGQAIALNNIGWSLAQLGEHAQALTYCTEALSLHQARDDRPGQASTWDSLGYINHQLADYPQAIACYESALALYEELSDQFSHADTLSRLGDTFYQARESTSARHAWQQALSALEKLRHPHAESVRAKLSGLNDRMPCSS